MLAVSSEFRTYVTAELENAKSELEKAANGHKKAAFVSMFIWSLHLQHGLHQMREQQRMQQELKKVERDEERQTVKGIEAIVKRWRRR